MAKAKLTVTRVFTGTQTPTQAFVRLMLKDAEGLNNDDISDIMNVTVHTKPVVSNEKGVTEIETADN